MKKLIFSYLLVSMYLISVAQWQQMGLNPYEIFCLATNGNDIFVGTEYELYYSNGNNNWVHLNVTSNIDTIFSIAINGNNIFVGRGNHGIYRSTDYGNTWTQVNGLTNLIVTSILINGNNIFAGTLNGIFLSTNNGDSWTEISNGLTERTIHALTNSGNYIIAGTHKGIFISADNGTTWTEANNGLPINPMDGTYPAIWGLVANGNTIFACTDGYGIFKATNNDFTWNSCNNGLSDIHVHSLAIKDQTIFAGTYSGAFISTTNGNQWNNANLPAPRVNCFAINNNYVYAGTGFSGVWKLRISDILQVDCPSQLSINCNDTITLTPTINYLGTGTLTYAWSPSAGLSNPYIQNPLASPSTTTTYHITVTDGTYSATDSVKVVVGSLNAPDICLVSVRNYKNIVVWNKPLNTQIDSFYIWRQNDITGQYEKIGAVSYTDSSIYVDYTSFPSIQSNKYKLSFFDKCGNNSPLSDYHKTIHLLINPGYNNSWTLLWEPYEGFPINSYKIYRGTSPNDLTLIGTTPGNITQYTDYTAPSGYVYYQIQAVNPNNCNPSKSYNITASNIATNDPMINEPISENNDFYIYPLISEDYITIESKSQSTKINIYIYDVNGKMLLKQKADNNLININISDLSSGLYILKILTDKTVCERKFIKK